MVFSISPSCSNDPAEPRATCVTVFLDAVCKTLAELLTKDPSGKSIGPHPRDAVVVGRADEVIE